METQTNSILNLSPILKKHGSIYWFAVGGGNVLYIGAYLRGIAELESLVRFVKENAELPEPTVGITFSHIPTVVKNLKVESKLCELDYKIIRSLKDDSRKATSVIAEELGISSKTVSRRLTRMINNYLVELSIEWYPDASNDIISAFHIHLKPGATPNTPDIIIQKYYPNTLFYWGFSNIPDVYVFFVWTPSSKELKETRNKIELEPAIQSVVPNIIYAGYVITSWRDEISELKKISRIFKV